MNIVRNENFWLAVDSYGQDIPDVSTLLSRMTTGGVGFSSQNVPSHVPDIGLAVHSLAKRDALIKPPVEPTQIVEASSTSLFDEVISEHQALAQG